MIDIKGIIFLNSFFIITSPGIISCNGNQLRPKAYVSFITDTSNGLRKTICHDRICFTAQYQPPEYLALLEFSQHVSKSSIDSLQIDFSGLWYFCFSVFAHSENFDPLVNLIADTNYYTTISFLSSDFHRCFLVVLGTDTLHCAIHQYEQNFGLLPQMDFQLGFIKPATIGINSEAPIRLFFDDTLFHTGLNQFTFRQSDLLNIPQLKM